MSHLLSVHGPAPTPSLGDSVGLTSRAGAQPAGPQAEQPKRSLSFLNPSYRFDSAMGMAVIEFHDDAGKVVSSIPNPRKLEAYRSHLETPGGILRPGAHPERAANGKTPVG